MCAQSDVHTEIAVIHDRQIARVQNTQRVLSVERHLHLALIEKSRFRVSRCVQTRQGLHSFCVFNGDLNIQSLGMSINGGYERVILLIPRYS